MIICRDKLLKELEIFVFSDGGVIIGSPGVGKTFLLKVVADKYANRCLYLPIDKLGVEIESDLKAELVIRGDFISYLRSQKEIKDANPNILIIDGFDAARSEIARDLYLSLIRRVITELHELWNVVVSVRTYDATKSEDLLDLFPASLDRSSPISFQSTTIHCRHFLIPRLSDEEIKAAVNSIPHLPSIYERALADFRELLRIPFNLWLLEKLLSLNPNIPELSTVNSEVQLLNLFWKQRVTDGSLGESRSMLLSKLLQKNGRTTFIVSA